MYEKTFPGKRFRHTLEFLKKHISPAGSFLDPGVGNPLSALVKGEGYTVENTKGEDLDQDLTPIIQSNATVATAVEIFEHPLSPFPPLRGLKTEKLEAGIPLWLWFSPAYRNKNDPWDRHYHKLEDWQFDWLPEKAGWQIKDRTRWTNPVRKIGLRPLLRNLPQGCILYMLKGSSLMNPLGMQSTKRLIPINIQVK